MSDNGTRSLDAIIASIEQTHSNLDSTLQAIEQRLTPEQVIDHGLDYLRHSAGREFLSNLGTSVKTNPMPATLVGIGIAWLIFASQRGNGTSERSRERSNERIDSASNGYRNIVQEQPLALAAVGLGLGAVLAVAAAPRTRQEDEAMGRAGDRVKQPSTESGGQYSNRAGAMIRASDEPLRSPAQDPLRQSAHAVASSEPRGVRRDAAVERVDQDTEPASAGSSGTTLDRASTSGCYGSNPNAATLFGVLT
jgi:hypothetical protein